MRGRLCVTLIKYMMLEAVLRADSEVRVCFGHGARPPGCCGGAGAPRGASRHGACRGGGAMGTALLGSARDSGAEGSTRTPPGTTRGWMAGFGRGRTSRTFAQCRTARRYLVAGVTACARGCTRPSLQRLELAYGLISN